jgi:hypothetical protein
MMMVQRMKSSMRKRQKIRLRKLRKTSAMAMASRKRVKRKSKLTKICINKLKMRK